MAQCEHMTELAQSLKAQRDAALADLAAANATIAAQSLALATMREALAEVEGLAHSAIFDAFNGKSLDVQVGVGQIREAALAILAQPDDGAAALAGAVLEAADQLRHWLHEYRGVIQVNAMRNGNDAELDLVDEALDAYRRARAALRGHEAVDG